MSDKPPHDDVKDALAAVIEIAIPPAQGMRNKHKGNVVPIFNSRFGGVSYG